MAEITGPNRATTIRDGPERPRATSSGRAMAMVLGSTSAKTSTRKVTRPVAMATPQAPGMAWARNSVTREDSRMFSRLLPSSTEPIMRSWFSISRLTRPAALSPSRSS